MLEHVSIRNVAIAEAIDWSLQTGFSVITGETGAGKSILFDSLMLCLGARSDTNVVRHGADSADITAHFQLTAQSQASRWLTEHELAADDECIITRRISKDGRSRSFINGRPCPQSLVRELGTILVNICGQHEHQRLVRKDQQRQFLDTFADHDACLAAVKKQFELWNDLSQQLEQLKQQDKDPSRLELLKFQVQELDELALADDEYEQLHQQQKSLASRDQLLQASNHSLAMLQNDEGQSILEQLNQCIAELSPFIDDPHCNNALTCLQQASIQCNEAADELGYWQDNDGLDDEALQNIETRLQKIHDIARKHHIRPSELSELHLRLQTELESHDNIEAKLNQLYQQMQQCEQQYQQAAKKLSRSRQKAADVLSKDISGIMQTLGMKHGECEIRCEPKTASKPSAHGNDDIEFLLMTNPGMPAQPLAKTASGGELSRICLAIQVCNARAVHTPTLLFDEVDVGIGGSTAEIVGRLLRQLGENAQVICVTHQPQVAGCANHHYQVTKTSDKKSTQTALSRLQQSERVAELARMLGGVTISDKVRASAEEMLV